MLADDLKHTVAIGHGIDEIAIDHHAVRLQAFQFGQYSRQGMAIAVNIGEEG